VSASGWGSGSPDHADNLRAAGLTALAVSLFAVSDAVVKLLATTFPPGQILFCRGVLACAFLAGLVWLRRQGGRQLPPNDRAIWLRSCPWPRPRQCSSFSRFS
jgi:drug/metabolite transporter (DMT)-like permease